MRAPTSPFLTTKNIFTTVVSADSRPPFGDSARRIGDSRAATRLSPPALAPSLLPSELAHAVMRVLG
jgi:hypothetical protein